MKDVPRPRYIEVRGLETHPHEDGTTDLDQIRKLPEGVPYYLWKRPGPPRDIRSADRVFLVSQEGIVGYCRFKEIDENKHHDKDGGYHKGPAIVIVGPFSPLNPPQAPRLKLHCWGSRGWIYHRSSRPKPR
jgi:hypothetical protein